MQGPDKILIIQTAGFGDHVLATALVETIAARHPAATIDVLIRKGNESVFAGNPHVRHALVWDKKDRKYPDLFRLLKEVRARSYDLVVNLHRFFNLGMLTLLSGARIRVGFDTSPVSRFFTHRVPYRFRDDDGSILHEVDRNQRLVERYFPGPSLRPRLYPGEDDLRKVEGYKVMPYVCIGVAASRFTNTLPREQWRDLIRSLPKGLTVHLLGAAEDIPRCTWIREASGRDDVTILAGQLTLVQSAALLKDALMTYACDSSVLHLASAMNAPVTAVYCSTDISNGFGPLSDVQAVVESTLDLPCRPCTSHGRGRCPREDFACARSITTEQLLSPLGRTAEP